MALLLVTRYGLMHSNAKALATETKHKRYKVCPSWDETRLWLATWLGACPFTAQSLMPSPTNGIRINIYKWPPHPSHQRNDSWRIVIVWESCSWHYRLSSSQWGFSPGWVSCDHVILWGISSCSVKGCFLSTSWSSTSTCGTPLTPSLD
jgi:hypothetical protein